MKKALRKITFLLFSAIMGCCFYVGCSLSTKIKVTYMAGGVQYTVQEYDLNQQIALPLDPVVEGQKFLGWYTDSACTQPYAEGKITAGLTLYAKFVPAAVYIKVNTDGGQAIPLIEVQPGGEYELPEAVKEGHTFTGYYYYDENGEKQDFPTSGVIAAGMSDMVVFASYTINKYTVTLNDGFSATPMTAEVEYNKQYMPNDANRPGYTFVAWHTVEENQTAATVYDATKPITADVELFAKYTANAYKITIANTADDTTEVVDVTYDADYALTAPVKTGWSFINYTYNGEEFAAIGTYTQAQNIRITANYSKNAYAVTFKDTDGNVITTKNVEHGKTVSEPTAELTKKGYSYTLSADLSAPITAATEITVTYTANPYTITIINSVGAPTQTMDVVYNGTYTLTANAVTGYTFTGFTFNGEAFDAEITYTYTNNIILTAMYAKNVYNVVFKDAVTGAEIKTVSAEHGTTISAPADLTKTGYTYVLSADLSAPITEDTEIVVTYTAKTASVTVIGAQADYVVPTITFGEIFTLEAPTRTGYIFEKFMGSDGKEYFAGQEYTCDFESLILTAEFDGDNKLVTFMVDGVQASQETILKDHKVDKPEDPTKTGYTFKGWSTKQSEYVAYNFASLVTTDMTLYAYFEAIPYTITIINNAGAAAQVVNVVYGGEYTLTANEIEGYTFSKFTLNDADFAANVTYTYTENIIVTAVYTKNVYTVSFVDATTGDTLATENVVHGDKVSAPNLAKEGYTYTLNKDLNAIITAPITITVTYTANTYSIHLNLDGGTGTEDVSVTFGKAFDLTELVPTKQGYIFDGYFMGDTEWTTGTYNVAGNTTLKAKWIENYRTVTFKVGDAETEEKVLDGSKVARPATPVKTGYTFNCWKLNNVEYDFSKAVTSDIELVADFSANIYTIYINNNGGTGDTNVSVTYDGAYNLNVPTQSGYDFVKFVDENGADFALSGKYVYEGNKSISAVWKKQMADSDKYFPEGSTYVYLVGFKYSFSNTAIEIKSFISGGADCVTLSSGKNPVLETHKPCEFIVQVTKYDINGTVVDTYERTMKIVEAVTSFTAGEDYRSAWINRNTANFDNNEKNDEMSVGRVDFRPDVKAQKLEGTTLVDLTLAEANLGIKVLADGVETEEYDIDGNSMTFYETLVGKTINVTIAPKYAIYENQTVTFTFKLNNGVNVYDNEGFKAAYSDTAVSEINVLRNIKMELSEDQIIRATGNEKTKVWGSESYKFDVPAGTVAPKNGQGGTAVYDRANGNLTINGNYFTADGSKIPLVDNRLDSWCFGSAQNGYILENVQFSLFKFGVDDLSKATNDLLQMNNLYILGNMGEATNWGQNDGETYKVNKDGTDYNMLTMSGAAIGVQARYANIQMDNVTIRRAVLGLNAYSTDERSTVNTVGESLHGETGSLHGTTIYAKDCIIEECWANDVYMWGFGLITLDSTQIGICSGAAIHIDSLPTMAKTNIVNSKMIFKNDVHVENLLSGEETWFNAYNMSAVAKQMKSTVHETGVKPATTAMASYGMLSNSYDAIKTNGNISMMNFALLVKAGGGSSDTEWLNYDKDGKPTVEVEGLSYLDLTNIQSNGLPNLVGVGEDRTINYTKFDASAMGFTGANHMEGYLGLFPAA